MNSLILILNLAFLTPWAHAIIGGTDLTSASPISHFTIALYDKKTQQVCTGSLIRDNFILTAAHCIETTASNIVIVFGLDFSPYDASNERLLRTASAVKIHPAYKSENPSDLDWNDLALIQFSGGLPEGYAPIALLHDSSLLKTQTSVQMAGFGATGVDLEEVGTERDKKFKQDLASGEIVCYDKALTQCYRVSFLGNDHLQSAESKIEGFTEKEIRLNGAKGTGTCVGDSGGPLLYADGETFYMIGVTSRGSPFCNGPAAYTNVLEYADWIRQTVLEFK